MKALIVVDMQKDFIDGSLGTQEALEIVPLVAEKIRGFEGDIFVTQDTHTENYLATQEGKRLPVRHCIEGTPGWELDPAVAAALAEKASVERICKGTFGSQALAAELQMRNGSTPYEEIQLVGLCTDICVIANAVLIKTALPEVPVSVDASCCAGVTPESHFNSLSAMQMLQIDTLNC